MDEATNGRDVQKMLGVYIIHQNNMSVDTKKVLMIKLSTCDVYLYIKQFNKETLTSVKKKNERNPWFDNSYTTKLDIL